MKNQQNLFWFEILQVIIFLDANETKEVAIWTYFFQMDRPSILEQGKDGCLNLPGKLLQGVTAAAQQGNKLFARIKLWITYK